MRQKLKETESNKGKSKTDLNENKTTRLVDRSSMLDKEVQTISMKRSKSPAQDEETLETIDHLQDQVNHYKKQVEEFQKISTLAAQEMDQLRGQLHTQTEKLDHFERQGVDGDQPMDKGVDKVVTKPVEKSNTKPVSILKKGEKSVRIALPSAKTVAPKDKMDELILLLQNVILIDVVGY